MLKQIRRPREEDRGREQEGQGSFIVEGNGLGSLLHQFLSPFSEMGIAGQDLAQ